ncbi:MAG TPA: GNAT family N-acetyltransferase [Candidatus Limnocylindria bacterium]|nr:GNAT family N-acetyltransferase [Candidatus Limnocylindria bacterium]
MSPPPILLDFPESFTSQRLLIRAPLPGDGVDVHAAVAESLDALRPWMPWALGPQSVEAAEARVREARAEFLARRDLRLHLYRREDGAFVGSSGLHRIHWEVPAFEIGYWIRTSETGRGYASEAARRIADFAFDQLAAERVEIWCDARNEPSAAVARRAGFALEARLNRHRRDTSGALSDSLCFVRFRD